LLKKTNLWPDKSILHLHHPSSHTALLLKWSNSFIHFRVIISLNQDLILTHSVHCFYTISSVICQTSYALLAQCEILNKYFSLLNNVFSTKENEECWMGGLWRKLGRSISLQRLRKSSTATSKSTIGPVTSQIQS
jgi:hypothetical protein